MMGNMVFKNGGAVWHPRFFMFYTKVAQFRVATVWMCTVENHTSSNTTKANASPSSWLRERSGVRLLLSQKASALPLSW